MKIAVFVSGRGSNLNAILNYPDLNNLIEIVAVVSDKIDCKAFETAREFGILTLTVGEGEGRIPQNSITAKLKILK